jgi:hypothetical protein
MPQSAATAAQAEPVIASVAEATAVLIEIGRLMSALCEIVEEETALVRGGRLTSAAKVAARKSELAGTFMSYASRVQASARYLARTTPTLLDELRRHHEQFVTALQINLTVLATARAVSEGILRGVSKELARRSTLTTYGASGRQHGPGGTATVPIALSRSL